MSTPTSTQSNDPAEPQLYRKPRADVFTVLLVIALLAIIFATVMLWQVMADYEYKFKNGPTVTWNGPAAGASSAVA